MYRPSPTARRCACISSNSGKTASLYSSRSPAIAARTSTSSRARELGQLELLPLGRAVVYGVVRERLAPRLDERRGRVEQRARLVPPLEHADRVVQRPGAQQRDRRVEVGAPRRRRRVVAAGERAPVRAPDRPTVAERRVVRPLRRRVVRGQQPARERRVQQQVPQRVVAPVARELAERRVARVELGARAQGVVQPPAVLAVVERRDEPRERLAVHRQPRAARARERGQLGGGERESAEEQHRRPRVVGARLRAERQVARRRPRPQRVLARLRRRVPLLVVALPPPALDLPLVRAQARRDRRRVPDRARERHARALVLVVERDADRRRASEQGGVRGSARGNERGRETAHREREL